MGTWARLEQEEDHLITDFSADTRSLEGGLPFVSKGRPWVKQFNVEYKKNVFRKSTTQRSMLPSVVEMGFDGTCSESKKPTAEISQLFEILCFPGHEKSYIE